MYECDLKTSPLQQALLFANLGFYDSAIPDPLFEYLDNLLIQSVLFLTNDCGIPIDPNDRDDAMLTAMYAAWLYRKGPAGDGKPPMLQTAIRNRQMRQAKGREMGK